ncbi:hypothetical protein ID866_2248 [Astraeus odoratus]|nr:hypothetical protein ID866_2248 [Astraeus odoratus]
MSDNLSFILKKVDTVLFEQRPIPDIAPHEVLIEVKKTGDSQVLGHESSGVIAKVGSLVTNLKPGDRVAVEPGATCRSCDACKDGRYELCPDVKFAATPPFDGTLGRYYAVPSDLAYPLPSQLTLEDGAMIEPLSVAVHSVIKQGAFRTTQSIVVFGCGPVGLLCMAVAKAVGACRIIAVDINPSRLDFAKSYAATDVFLPPQQQEGETRIGFSKRVAAAMKAELDIAERGPKGIDLVVDASGAEVSIQTGIRIVKSGGTYVQVGMGQPDVTIDITHLLCKELTVKGSFRYGLYLDDRHIDWMSDRVLQHVLADLRPLIVPKLQAEKDTYFGPGAASEKKGTVEVHRGDSYQFAYFFRKIEAHSIVTKSRHFVAAPAPPPRALPKPSVPSTSVSGRADKKKRNRRPTVGRSSRKRQKTTIDSEESDVSAEASEGDDIQIHDDSDKLVPRRSQRLTGVTPSTYRESEEDAPDGSNDVDISSPLSYGRTTERKVVEGSPLSRNNKDREESTEGDSPRQGVATEIDLTVEDEEEKPKPLLRVKYQALTVSSHCLCVVVEPWPSQHATARAQSVRLSQAMPSNSELSKGGESSVGRGRTPLFLPEFGEASDHSHETPTPLFDDSLFQMDDENYDDTLISFSQSLNIGSHAVAAPAEDDDDMDGAVLFGDADEVREFS